MFGCSGDACARDEPCPQEKGEQYHDHHASNHIIHRENSQMYLNAVNFRKLIPAIRLCHLSTAMAAVRELGTNFLADSFFITLFDILQGLIFSLLLLVFLTALFSSTVNRSKTWFIFMGSVIEWCASYLLLIGQQIGNPPPVALCTFQSAGIYSSNPLCVLWTVLLLAFV